MGSTDKHKSHREGIRTQVPGTSAAGTRKVVIDFPEPLFERTERAASEPAVDRSSLIRSAVEQFLEALHRKRLDAELAAGYAANAELDRRIAVEFASVDCETF